MNRIHKRRIYLILICTSGILIATSLILYALRQNINVFVTPSELTNFKTTTHYSLKLGGVVQPDSIKRNAQDLYVKFTVTDFKHTIPVIYYGVLPDLFREGKGVVAEGKLMLDGSFKAERVLAKHDENYIPKEVYQKLRQNKETL